MPDTENQLDLLDDKVDPKPEDIEVIVEGDESEPEKAEREELSPEKGLEELRAQVEAANRARMEAEERARQAAEMARAAQTDVQETNMHLLRSAIDTLKRDNDILKANYRDAMQVGDYEKAAEIQEQLSGNAAKLLQIESGREEMEIRMRQPVRPVEPPRPSDPVEAFAQQLSPRSADWVRRNPQCVTDPRLHQKMIAAHNLAVMDGLQPDTDEYFREIETTLKLRRAEQAEEKDDAMSSAAKTVTRRDSAPPAAPVSRSGAPGKSPAGSYTLTKAEAEAARDMGMTPREYALNKEALVKAGRLNR